jgi:hypothetical protein
MPVMLNHTPALLAGVAECTFTATETRHDSNATVKRVSLISERMVKNGREEKSGRRGRKEGCTYTRRGTRGGNIKSRRIHNLHCK